jgi:neutral ceramidase
MFNWFPVHGVSYSKQNRLLTGDNKGYAAYLFEQAKGALYPGHGRYAESTGFVAGFANSNPGDLTANLRNSEPGGWPENGEDDGKRATTIGRRQYEKAMALYETLTEAEREKVPQVLRVWLRYRSEKYFGDQRTPPGGGKST